MVRGLSCIRYMCHLYCHLDCMCCFVGARKASGKATKHRESRQSQKDERTQEVWQKGMSYLWQYSTFYMGVIIISPNEMGNCIVFSSIVCLFWSGLSLLRVRSISFKSLVGFSNNSAQTSVKYDDSMCIAIV